MQMQYDSGYGPLPTRRGSGSWLTHAIVAVLAAGLAVAVVLLFFSPASGVAAGSGAVPTPAPSSAPLASSQQAIVSKVKPGLVLINTTLQYDSEVAAGTGMVVNADGLVLTNNHVIEDSTKITATVVSTGKTYQARVVGYDQTGDVALIQLQNASGLTTVPIGNSSSAKTGEAIVAMGNAEGQGHITPTPGHITALNQSITASDEAGSTTSETLHGTIETNADIVPGDSGGPLASSAGVIGMDTAGNDPSGQEPAAGFAIPIDTALSVARQELTVMANLQGALSDTPGIGLEAGTRYHLTTYGIWGFALISSPTWRSALDVGLRYIDLTFAFTRIQAREQGQDMQLVLDTPEIPVALKRFVVERDSAAIQTIQQELFASPIPIKQVSFVFPPPERRPAVHRDLRCRAGLRSRGEHGGHRPVGAGPAATAGQRAHHRHRPGAVPRAARPAARPGRTGRRVRDQLLARAADPPDLGQVAAALNVSDRTLRRRLADEGVSFRGLLDEIREQLAEELLVTGGLPVTEVAERLGYLEVSSFSQAFRRWKGVGPRTYRADHRTHDHIIRRRRRRRRQRPVAGPRWRHARMGAATPGPFGMNGT